MLADAVYRRQTDFDSEVVGDVNACDDCQWSASVTDAGCVSTLPLFESRVGLVDDVYAAFAADYSAAGCLCFYGCFDFHVVSAVMSLTESVCDSATS